MSPAGRRPVSLRFAALSAAFYACFSPPASAARPTRPGALLGAQDFRECCGGASIEALIPDYRQVISRTASAWCTSCMATRPARMICIPSRSRADPERLTLPGFNGERSMRSKSRRTPAGWSTSLTRIPMRKKSSSACRSTVGAPGAYQRQRNDTCGDVKFYFEISPGSDRVVYTADQEVDEQEKLYSVPIGGGTVIRINHDLATNADVFNHRLTPDGERVVFRVNSNDTHWISCSSPR